MNFAMNFAVSFVGLLALASGLVEVREGEGYKVDSGARAAHVMGKRPGVRLEEGGCLRARLGLSQARIFCPGCKWNLENCYMLWFRRKLRVRETY